jgi:Sec-independent protein translocase protein TatA
MSDLLIVLIVILVIAVIVRGPKTLPQLGAMLGRGAREARDQVRDTKSSGSGGSGSGRAGSGSGSDDKDASRGA